MNFGDMEEARPGAALPLPAPQPQLLSQAQLAAQQVQPQPLPPAPPLRIKPTIKPTLKRYVILFLFCLNSANKAFQWIQIPASTNKVTYFYDVDNYVINATSVLFMLSFVVLSWPACFFIERIGLRNAVLIGSFGTLVGSVIKCFACTTSGIYLLFLGQTVVSLSEQFIFSVPSRLASVWFPDHQVSSAVAMAVLGNQVGVALGFVIPQSVMETAVSRDEIGQALYWMFLGTALVSGLALVADVVLFDEAPKHAPGRARCKQIERERQLREQLIKRGFVREMGKLWHQIKELLGDRHFVQLVFCYGIILGIGYTLATLLNQMMEPIWPGDDILVGVTGFVVIVSGALGSPFWGQLLDKLHRYKAINLAITVGTIVSLLMLAYAMSVLRSEPAVYLSAALFGLFQTGFIVSGLEFGVELTYPTPELVSSSVMNVMPQICGSVFIFVGSYIVDNHGTLATNAFYLACLAVALGLLLATSETLKRQKAVIEKKASLELRRSLELARRLQEQVHQHQLVCHQAPQQVCEPKQQNVEPATC